MSFMKLYPYQKKIFDAALSHLKEKNRLMIVIPTGGGKTVVFAHLIKKLNLKTLVVAHTRELISQCQKTLANCGITGVDVFTIQKVYMHIDEMDDYDFLIVDECHRSCSPSYLKLIERFNDKKVLGVTATPFRSDGQWLFDIYKEKIAPLDIIDMIEQNFLSDFEGYRVKTTLSLKGISTKGDDFVSSKLAAVVNVKNRNELIVREYRQIADGEKTLCFAVNIKHADELAKEFQANGIASESIHGDIAKHKREQFIQDFKTGKIRVLVSCQILTEGFDEPSITCLLMARPTLSKVLYIQMIGRGSRLYPGKSVCKVIEFTDNHYDVCSLESIISSNSKSHSLIRGERLGSYKKRVESLLEETKDVTVEKFTLVDRNYTSKPATPWQIKFLGVLGVGDLENITQLQADEMIRKYSNGTP